MINKKNIVGSLVIFTGVFLIFWSNAEADPIFKNLNYYSINVPGQIATLALGINRFGEIVGTESSSTQVQTGGYQTDSFAWTSDGFTIFDKIRSTYSQANGVNANGYIVGDYRDSNVGGNIFHGYIIKNGIFSTFDVPGSGGTSIQTINDLGTIGGGYDNSYGNGFGFTDNNGVLRKFSYGDGTATVVTGINNHGDIAGFFHDNGLVSGFAIINGVFEAINVPGSYYTTVWGINDNNQVVGDYFTGASVRHGFVYTDYKYYNIEFPGYENTTVARGINDAGVIVGGYQVGSVVNGFVATNGTFDSVSVGEPPMARTLGLATAAMVIFCRRRRSTRMGSVISNTIST